VVSSGKSRKDAGRIYFSEVGDATLHKCKSWFVAQLNDKNGDLIKNFYSKSELKAKRFIDSVLVLKAGAKDRFGS